MSSTPMPHAELRRLIAGAVEESLTDQETIRLRKILLADPAARRMFRSYLTIVSGLTWDCVHSASHNPARDVPSAPAPKPLPIIGILNPLTSTVSRPVTWSVLAVGVLFAGYIVVISWNMLGREAVDRRLKAVASDSDADLQPSASSLQPDAVATITATEDAQWSPHVDKSLRDLPSASQRDATTRPEITPHEPLAITSGLVELELEQGTTLVIEGPAEWKINGENSATLSRGKLIAKVPQKAVGFTLETPTARIIDLGTEFTAEVGSNGMAEVHVLKGAIDVESSSGPKKLSTLTIGQGARITSAGVQVHEWASIPEEFNRLVEASKRSTDDNAEPTKPLDRWREAGNKRRTDPDLVGYYDFEQSGEILKNLVANTMHGEIISQGKVPWIEGRWFGKQCLAFGERFAHVCIPEFTRSRDQLDCTLVVWLRLDVVSAKDALLIGKGRYPHRNFAVWLRPGKNAAGLTLSWNQANGELKGAGKAEIIQPNRWHMVVAVLKRDEIQLFHNGVAITDQVRFVGPPLDDDSPLVVGRSLEPENPEYFTGAIDELAVFRRALSENEIRHWYDEGKPK